VPAELIEALLHVAGIRHKDKLDISEASRSGSSLRRERAL
jgi:hypothetical protein